MTPWSLAATGRDLADLDTWPREGRPSRVREVPYDPERLKPDEEPLDDPDYRDDGGEC